MNKDTYIYITPFFPSPKSWRGGYGYDFVKALMRTGKYDVRVFKPGYSSDYEIGGINVSSFRTVAMPSNVFPFLTSPLNRQYFMQAICRLGIDPAKIAVCHANTAEYSIYPLAIKRVNPKCLTVLHHHNLASFGFCAGRLRNNTLYRMIQIPILRGNHKKIDVHVFISKLCKENFVKDSGIEPRHSMILHNGVDTTIFYPDKKRVRNCTGKTFTIGTIANFQKTKGYFQIIKALERIKDKLGEWRWLIIGSGADAVAIKKKLASAGISSHVEVLPEVRHEELPRFYRSLDLFVLPSYWEGFGCVYTEAFACGVPFIASKRGNGIVDLAPSDWLVDPDDEEELAQAILRMRTSTSKFALKSEWRIQPLVDSFVRALGVLK